MTEKNSPLKGQGKAEITKTGDNEFTVNVTALDLISQESKVTKILGFRVGLISPGRSKASAAPVTGELHLEEALVAPTGSYSTHGLTGVIPGEPGVPITSYEVRVAMYLSVDGGQTKTHWIRHNIDQAAITGGPELLELRKLEKEATAKVSEPYQTLCEQYLIGLEKIKTRQMQAGDLEGVLATTKEIAAVSGNGAAILDLNAYPDLKKVRTIFQTQEARIADEALSKLTAWLQTHYTKIVELQTRLTKEEKIIEALAIRTEALRIKKLIDDPNLIGKTFDLAFLTRTKNEPKVASATAITDPPAGPDPLKGPDPFQDPNWHIDQKIGPGVFHGGKERINIKEKKQDDPKPEINFVPGTEIVEAFILIDEGIVSSDYSKFTESRIQADLGGTFIGENSLFEETSFRKGGAWAVKLWSSKWKFTNCVFSKSFYSVWTTKGISTIVKDCTLYDIKIPSLKFEEDGGAEAGTDQFIFDNCRFIECTVPLSMLIATKNCAFEKCTFIDDSDTIIGSERASVTPYIVGLGSKLPTSKDARFSINAVNEDQPKAGATLEYTRSTNGKLEFDKMK